MAYVLLTASMVAGVFLHSRLMQRMASPIARMEWHKVLAILALLMVGLHGLGLVMDTYVNTGWLDLIVPGLATYRTLWTGFGVVALWLMLIVSATAGARKLFKARTWKGIHFASYAAFIGATVHGLWTGTDSGLPWMLAIYIASTGLVVGVAARRFLSGPNAPLKRRRAARAASERASHPDHAKAVPESTPVHVEIPPLPPIHDDTSDHTRELTMPAGDRG